MTLRRKVLSLDSVFSLGRSDEDFSAAAGFGAWRPDDAFLFHAFDQFGGLVVADAQLPLDVADRTVASVRHHGHGLVVERVVALASEAVVITRL